MTCLITVALFAVLAGSSSAQVNDFYPVPVERERAPLAPESAEIAFEPLDSAVAAFGLSENEVSDVLRLSVEGAGWDISAAADIVITVRITPLPQREEDLFTFQIDVSTASQSKRIGEGTGGLSGSAKVDVPQGGGAKLLSHVNQLVSKVSRRLRQEVMKRSIMLNRKVELLAPWSPRRPIE